MKEEIELKGLGGWLILLAIGFFISFITLGRTIWVSVNAVVVSELWSKLVDPNSLYYIPNFNWAYTLELFFNVIFLLLNGYVTYLFFRKNYKFPKFFIFFEVSYFCFLILDTILSNVILKLDLDLQTIKPCILAIIRMGIWIPYMLNSVRVKNTFINGRRSKVHYSGIVS